MAFLTEAANRGSISTGYDIDNSVCWEPDLLDQAYRSQGSTAGTRTKQTFSVWLKRTELGGDQYIFEGGTGTANNTQFGIQFSNSNKIQVMRAHTSGGYQYLLNTNRLFRDTSAWYHIVVAVDTTLGTADNRVRLYVNGVEETSFANRNNPSQNDELGTFAANAQTSLGVSANLGKNLAAYMAEPCLIYDAQLAPTSFGEFDASGIWKPKDLSGLTFGTYGYWLEFETNNTVGDANGLGHDSSGNDNDFSRFDSTIKANTDTPTNNFQTFLSDGTIFNVGQDNMTFSEGGTKYSRGQTGWTTAYTNIAMTNGKWYMEFENHGTGSNTFFGLTPVARTTSSERQNYYTGQASDGTIGYYMANGQIYWQGSSSGGVSSSTGDIIGVAVDIDNNKAYWHKNGTYMNSADPAAGSNGSTINDEPYFFACSTYNPSISGETNTGGHSSFAISSAATDANGYGTFEYAPPSGYYALCTKNLAEYG